MPTTFLANSSQRCLYHDSLRNFCAADETFVFGTLCANYHGEALTLTRDAWRGELAILKQVLSRYDTPKVNHVFVTIKICQMRNHFVQIGMVKSLI